MDSVITGNVRTATPSNTCGCVCTFVGTYISSSWCARVTLQQWMGCSSDASSLTAQATLVPPLLSSWTARALTHKQGSERRTETVSPKSTSEASCRERCSGVDSGSLVARRRSSAHDSREAKLSVAHHHRRAHPANLPRLGPYERHQTSFGRALSDAGKRCCRTQYCEHTPSSLMDALTCAVQVTTALLDLHPDPAAVESDIGESYVVRGAARPSHSGRFNPRYTCYTCKEVGHCSNACLNTTCHKCKERGHYANHCPELQLRHACQYCDQLGHDVGVCKERRQL